MKLVTLSDFQKLAGLSDKALSWLLTRNLVACQTDAARGILVDLDSVETGDLLKSIAARRSRVLREGDRLMMEKLAAVATRNFEDIIEQVVREIEKREA